MKYSCLGTWQYSYSELFRLEKRVGEIKVENIRLLEPLNSFPYNTNYINYLQVNLLSLPPHQLLPLIFSAPKLSPELAKLQAFHDVYWSPILGIGLTMTTSCPKTKQKTSPKPLLKFPDATVPKYTLSTSCPCRTVTWTTSFLNRLVSMPGTVAHAWEAEVGGWQVWGLPEQQNKTPWFL